MFKKYETPNLAITEFAQTCEIFTSDNMGLEPSGDGQWAPDIFVDS